MGCSASTEAFRGLLISPGGERSVAGFEFVGVSGAEASVVAEAAAGTSGGLDTCSELVASELGGLAIDGSGIICAGLDCAGRVVVVLI